jgi:ABC-type sugar transport system permease subunit
MLFFLCSDLILCIIPPLVFAFLLTIIRNKTLSNWVRSLMFIPGIIPGMATMLIWREGIYGADGVMNQILMMFGKDPIAFLDNTAYSRWSLIMMGFPFVGGYLIFYGGMMNIPNEYHEAGWLEGLGVVKRFFLIDIPLIMPQIKYIFIMTFISSVQNYARTYILGSAGTITPVESMYRIMTGAQADYGMASAYATIIFVFLFVAVAANFKMQKKDTMGEDL